MLSLQLPARVDYDNVPTRRSLLHRLRDSSDDVSWRSFFDTYWRLIYTVARKSGLSDADAQDVVQETVISVAKKMPEFRYDPAKGSFKQWLLVLTRRRIHDHLRRVYRSLPSVPGGPAAGERMLALAPETSLPPDEQVNAAWEQEWRENFFQMALSRVRQRSNPKHYQVFDCCVLQCIPAAQVARMLGVSAGQVYLAKHRVSRAIKRALAEIESELGQTIR